MNENETNENTNNQTADQQTDENPKVEKIAYEQPEVENEPNKKMMILAVIALCLIVAVMVGLSFIGKNKEANEAVKTQVSQIGTEIRNKDFSLPPELKQKEFNEFTYEAKPETESFKESPLATQAKIEATKSVPKPQVFKTGGSLAIAANGATHKDETHNLDQNISWTQQAKILEEEREYEGDTFTPKAASKSKFNPSLLLQKGTYIGCSLNTRLVSQIKGGISCTTSENIYSKDGVTLLIEKGSKIFGSFRSGEMNDGINRIFVVWSEIRTPNNVVIPVQSGAGDKLGGSGMEGYVDHQWMKRFGASVLLSMIDDVFNYVANGKRDNNNDFSENTRDATQQMANTVLSEFIKIKPVLYINQGDIVGVYVNRDIDFSKVYKLKVGKKQ